jgi:flavodoxin
MKKIMVPAVFSFCVMAAMQLGAQSQTGTRRILIAYFSQPETGGVDTVSGASRVNIDGKVSGNVQFVANIIQKTVGGDLFVIQTVQAYPTVHNALTDYAKNEQQKNTRPRLAARIPNLQDYDTIFLGYPIWWYDLPMSIYSFLDEYNFTGKTIIPFTVHGGSRLSGTVEKLTQLEPGAKVIQDGLAVSRNSVARSERDVTAWIRRLGLTQ